MTTTPEIFIGDTNIADNLLSASFRRSMMAMTGSFQLSLIPGTEPPEAIGQEVKCCLILPDRRERRVFTGVIEQRKETIREQTTSLNFSGRGLLSDAIDSNPPVDYDVGDEKNLPEIISKLLNSNTDGESSLAAKKWGVKTDDPDKPIAIAVLDYAVNPEVSIERNIRRAMKGLVGLHLFEDAHGEKVQIWRDSEARESGIIVQPEQGVEITISTDTSKIFSSYHLVTEIGTSSSTPQIIERPDEALYLPRTIRPERKYVRSYEGKDKDGLNQTDEETTDASLKPVNAEARREGRRRLVAAESVNVSLPGFDGDLQIGDIITLHLPGLPNSPDRKMMVSETELRIANASPGHLLNVKLSHITAWEGEGV